MENKKNVVDECYDRLYFNFDRIMILFHNLYVSVYNEIPYLIEFDDKLLCKFYNKYNSLEIYYYL